MKFCKVLCEVVENDSLKKAFKNIITALHSAACELHSQSIHITHNCKQISTKQLGHCEAKTQRRTTKLMNQEKIVRMELRKVNESIIEKGKSF